MRFKWQFYPVRDFAAHQDTWQRTNLLGPASPLLSPSFLGPLLNEFAHDDALIAVCGNQAAPDAMGILSRMGPGQWQTFQPHQAPMGTWVQRRGLPTGELLESLVGAIPGPAFIVGLTQQDPDLLPRLADGERLATLDYIDTARVSISGTFDAYWNARGKNLRQNMRKQRNRLQSEGINTTLEVLTSPEEMREAVTDYGRLETAGWKATGGTAVSVDSKQGSFYRRMLEAFCRQGRGKVYRYRFNRQVVAVDLCVEDDTTLVILKTTYDESVKAYSPAFLMREEAFRQIYEEGRIKRIEFYGKVMEWHKRWTDEVRTMYHLTHYRWRAVPALRQMIRPLRAPALPSPAPQWTFAPVSEFERYVGAWQSVFNQRPRPLVLDARFIRALLEFFATGDEIIAIYGPPQAPLAIGIIVRCGPGAWEAFTSMQGPLSAWMQRDDQSYEQLMPSLTRALPGVAIAMGIPQKDPDFQARPQESAQLEVLDYVETMRIRVDRTFPEYWESRDAGLRHQIERRLRRLGEQGIKPRLEAVTHADEVAEAVAEFGRIESAGWKGEAGSAVHIDNQQGKFYARMLREFCLQGKGAVYRYRFNDVTVAMEMCIEQDDTFIMLKTTYDEAYKTHAPGILMRREIFERVFASGHIKQIEFYGKVQPWQLKWGSDTRALYHVNYYRWGWVPKMKVLHRTLASFTKNAREDVESADAAQTANAPGLPSTTPSSRTIASALRVVRAKAAAFAHNTRQLGWLNGCLYGLDRLLDGAYKGRARVHKYYLVTQPVPAKTWLPARRGADLEIRQLQPSDRALLGALRPAEVIELRFRQNAICLACLRKGKCVGFMWLAMNAHYEDEVRCRYVPLPEGKAAWDFDVYVTPKHRTGVAFLKLWDAANKFLAARGMRSSLSRISAFNPLSMHSHHKLGAQRIGSVTFFSAGSWQLALSTVPPYFHFSTDPESFPVYALSPPRPDVDAAPQLARDHEL
jgi:CelD/BcsL family acetyltransferase involved in cellulose biosynthesis